MVVVIHIAVHGLAEIKKSESKNARKINEQRRRN